LLLLGFKAADAAYRIVFQNGTSLEVQLYEDLGDAIRYQRYEGTVVVPKAHVTTIQGVPSPAPPHLLPHHGLRRLLPEMIGDHVASLFSSCHTPLSGPVVQRR